MAHTDRLAELQRGLMAVLDEAMRLDGATFGKIRVAAPGTGVLEVQAQRGFSDGFIKTFRRVERTDPIPSAQAARLRRRVSLPDLTKQPKDDPYVAAAREEGVKAMQATPIVASQGQVLGTLCTHFSETTHVSWSSAIALDHCARRAAQLIESLLPASMPL